MPLGLGKSPYTDVSQNDADEEEQLTSDNGVMHRPPYSDKPPNKRQSGHGHGGGNGGNADAGNDDHEAHGARAARFEMESLQVHGAPAKYHRGGLLCAYLTYWCACRCCECRGETSKHPITCSRRASRVLRGLSFVVVLAVIAASAAAIGYVIAQEREHRMEVEGFTERLERVCGEESLKTLNGIQQCHGKCQTHLCCFAEDGYSAGEGHCDDANIHSDACAAYAPCKRLVILEESALNGDSVQPAAVAAAVTASCTLPADITLIDENWVTGCHTVCASGLCCLHDVKIGSNCHDILGSGTCSAYAPCQVLVDANHQLTEDPQEVRDIKNLCSSETVMNLKERSACETLCNQRSCCFEKEAAYSCYSMEQEWCDEFKACRSIDLLFMELDAKSSVSGVDAKVGSFIDRLDRICNEDSLKTLDGIQQCHDMCQTHLCCFTGDGFFAGEGHCEDVNIDSDSCLAYEPCSRLVILEKNALDGQSNNDSTLLEVADSVKNLCALPDDPGLIDESWVTNCHAICAPRLCCVLDANIGSNCRDVVALEECRAYAPCEVLVDSSIGQVMRDPHAIGDIENICSIDLVQNLKERNACEFRCKQRSCCFEEEAAYSCYSLEKDWCNEFKACSSLSSTVPDDARLGNGGSPISASDPNDQKVAPNEPHPLNPQWYQTTHVDFQQFLESKDQSGNNNPHDWHGANILCAQQGLFLCDYDTYCPNGQGAAPFQGGPPKLYNHDTIEVTQWSPYMGPAKRDPSGTHWVQIGHLSAEEGGSEENNFIQCWKYDDWYAGNGVDIVEVWEAKHRVYILCCESKDGEE